MKRIPAYLFATGKPKSDSVYVRITRLVVPASVTAIGEYAFYTSRLKIKVKTRLSLKVGKIP